MKKLLLVLSIAAFVACNDEAKSDETATDSASMSTVDTTTVIVPDTTMMSTDTTKMSTDTTRH